MLEFLASPRDRRRRERDGGRLRAHASRSRIAARFTPGASKCAARRARPRCRSPCRRRSRRSFPAVLSRVKHAFDLTCDPEQVALALGTLAAKHPGLRVPGTFDGFELAVRAIVGQQVSVRGARTVLGRLARTFGTAADRRRTATSRNCFRRPRGSRPCRPRSSPASASRGARARAIVALAHGDGRRAIWCSIPKAMSTRRSRALRACRASGRGPRSTSRCARCAGPTRSWPATSWCGGRSRVARPAQALERARAWQPWRAYAVMHLWRSTQ